MDALHFDYRQVKGTFDWNVITHEFTTSHRTNRILGFSPQERITYDDFISSLHQEDKQVWEHSISNNFPNEYMKIEARLATAKCFKWLRIHGKIVYDKQQQPAHIHGSIQDITELKELFNELKDSEQKFHLLADTMPLKVWTSDAFGNFDFFNHAVYDFTGLDIQQLKSGGWSRLLHPDDLEKTMSISRKAIDEAKE
jgi:PAS domain-containing protein